MECHHGRSSVPYPPTISSGTVMEELVERLSPRGQGGLEPVSWMWQDHCIHELKATGVTCIGSSQPTFYVVGSWESVVFRSPSPMSYWQLMASGGGKVSFLRVCFLIGPSSSSCRPMSICEVLKGLSGLLRDRGGRGKRKRRAGDMAQPLRAEDPGSVLRSWGPDGDL